MKLRSPYTIDGIPILGTYVAHDLEALEAVSAVGMNMVIGGKADLDASTETGRFCRENGIGIHYHMTGHIYGKPRLKQKLFPDETTVAITMGGGHPTMSGVPDSGVVQIDDELIRYGRCTDDELLDCIRGVDGTAPAEHREGVILFWPEPCAEEVEQVRSLENMRGYYVLDDSPGDAASALRAMYGIIRRIDPDRESRPVVAGYGSFGALCNLGPGICDLMMIYWYPVSDTGYNRTMTGQWTQWVMASARKLVPGIPFLGVYQVFNGGSETVALPTADQLREQLHDFIREGASGLVAFLCKHVGMDGFASQPYMQEVLSEIHTEIRETGGVEIPDEPAELAALRMQPLGNEGAPVDVPGVPPAWHVLGAFVADDGFETVLPPDETIDLDGVYAGKSGDIRWNVRSTYAGAIGIGELHGSHVYTSGTTSYATCTVASPTARRLQMRVCTDDDGTVRLNGEVVYSFSGGRGVEIDKDTVEVDIPAGESRLIVKVHNRNGMHGFFLRFTELGGDPAEGLEFAPSPT